MPEQVMSEAGRPQPHAVRLVGPGGHEPRAQQTAVRGRARDGDGGVRDVTEQRPLVLWLPVRVDGRVDRDGLGRMDGVVPNPVPVVRPRTAVEMQTDGSSLQRRRIAFILIVTDPDRAVRGRTPVRKSAWG